MQKSIGSLTPKKKVRGSASANEGQFFIKKILHCHFRKDSYVGMGLPAGDTETFFDFSEKIIKNVGNNEFKAQMPLSDSLKKAKDVVEMSP